MFGINYTAHLLFNVSHWMFSFKYYSMSRQTPFKAAKQEMPRGMIRCYKVTNWVFLILNAIPPILSGVGYIGYYSAGTNGNMEMSNIFLQLGNIFGLFTLFLRLFLESTCSSHYTKSTSLLEIKMIYKLTLKRWLYMQLPLDFSWQAFYFSWSLMSWLLTLTG